MLNTTRIQIDLDALRHNYRVIKRIAPKSRAFAVVKSDAYGHGLLRIASALPEADGFATVQLDDLKLLRAHDLRAPVLLMEGVLDADELTQAARLDGTIALCNREQLALVQRTRLPQPLKLWVKVNIGMNRFGFRPDEVEGVLAELDRCPNARVQGLMTHFPSADDLDTDLHAPWQRFLAVVQRTGLPFTAANSAAVLRDAHTHGALVRTGSILYGNNPFVQPMPFDHGFIPVMRLESELIALTEVRKGESLGYGASFVADRDLRVGLVGCGYGDGYPYTAPTGTPVLVNGRRSRTVGKVAMNVLAVDLTHLPDADQGDVVTVWGDPALRIAEVADACGIVSEALECGLTKRLPVCVIERDQSTPCAA